MKISNRVMKWLTLAFAVINALFYGYDGSIFNLVIAIGCLICLAVLMVEGKRL